MNQDKNQFIYVYNENEPFVMSNKNDKITIDPHDGWQILRQNNDSNHILIHKSNVPFVIGIDDDTLLDLQQNSVRTQNSYDIIQLISDNQFKHSNKINKNQNNKISKNDNQQIVETDTDQAFYDIEKWLKQFKKMIKQSSVSIAANAEEIKNCLATYESFADQVVGNCVDINLNADQNEIDREIKKAKQQLKKPPEMQLNARDHKLRKGYFKYIPAMEKLIKNYIDRSIGMAQEKKGDLTLLVINDSMDFFNIVQHLHQGNIQKTMDSTSMDTSPREELPDNFWEGFVETIRNQKEPYNYMKQKEQEHKTMIKNKEKKDIERGIKQNFQISEQSSKKHDQKRQIRPKKVL